MDSNKDTRKKEMSCETSTYLGSQPGDESEGLK